MLNWLRGKSGKKQQSSTPISARTHITVNRPINNTNPINDSNGSYTQSTPIRQQQLTSMHANSATVPTISNGVQPTVNGNKVYTDRLDRSTDTVSNQPLMQARPVSQHQSRSTTPIPISATSTNNTPRESYNNISNNTNVSSTVINDISSTTANSIVSSPTPFIAPDVTAVAADVTPATSPITNNNFNDDDFRMSDELIAWRLQQEEYERHSRQARAATHRSNSLGGSSRVPRPPASTLMGYTPIPTAREQRRHRTHRSNTSDTADSRGDYADRLAAELVRSTRTPDQRSRSHQHTNTANGILHGTEEQQRRQLQQLINITGLEATQNETRLSRTADQQNTPNTNRTLRNLFGNMLSGSISQPTSVHNSPQTVRTHPATTSHYRAPQSTKKPASVLLVESLPTFRYKQCDADSTVGSTKEDLTCSICISEFEDNEVLRALPCIHRFHRDCIDKWLSINRLCPTCNTDVKKAVQAR